MDTDSVLAVEKILNYSFLDKCLLKEALTRRPCGCVESSPPLFERLEFLGDSVLELAFTNYIDLTYPNLKLTELHELLRSNVSNEKFARVAVKHNLHQFIRHSHDLTSGKRFIDFSEAVSKEDEPVPYGGLVKAPKRLADVVEAIAAAVYIDVNYNVQRVWEIMSSLFEPIYTLDDLRRQAQPPFLTLFRFADKHGKRIDFRYRKDDDTNKNVAEVYLDDIFIASGCAKRIDSAKLIAAKQALQKLSESMPTEKVIDEDNLDVDTEVEKRKLFEICSEKTPTKVVIDEGSLNVEPADVKGKVFKNCSTRKLHKQTQKSSLPTASENPLNYDITPKEKVIDEDCLHVEPEATKKLQLQSGSSSLPTTSEKTCAMTQEQIVIDEDVKGKVFEFCSTRNSQIQPGSSSSPTASEMTPTKMAIDEASSPVEPEDVKGKLIQIRSTTKLQTRSYSFPSANPLIYEMTVKEVVVDENSLELNAISELITICAKNKWPTPIFSVEEERNPKRELKFVCSVKVEIPSVKSTFHMKGDAKSRKQQAENSSAYHMIRALKSSLMSLVFRNLQMTKSLDGKTNLHSKKSTGPLLDAVALSSEKDYASVEKILNYSFVNKNLLKEALTLTTNGSRLFDRYIFVGLAALSHAFMNHIYITYPKLELKDLRKLRDANTSNHHLARVAVKHGLLRDGDKVITFLEPVSQYKGILKPPKILYNLVESIAGAVYIDVNFDVQRLWEIIRFLFEPIYTLEDLRVQYVGTLIGLGEKQGKRIDFRVEESRAKGKVFAQVYLDDEFLARGRAKINSDAAKQSAAEIALGKLSASMPIDIVMDEYSLENDPKDAKEKLLEICNKRKWPKPVYSLKKEGKEGHYVCSAKIESPTEEGTLCVQGDKRKKRKKAEISSAANMLRALVSGSTLECGSSLKDDL